MTVRVATLRAADEAAAEALVTTALGGRLQARLGEVHDVLALSAARVWLVTTNDNLDAFRLYLRHGFRLEQVHLGGVDLARELKPSIPLIGEHGIPLHDEWVLVRHC